MLKIWASKRFSFYTLVSAAQMTVASIRKHQDFLRKNLVSKNSSTSESWPVHISLCCQTLLYTRTHKTRTWIKLNDETT